MRKWLSFGQQTISQHSTTLNQSVSLADFPPGVPLPLPQPPDFSTLSPRVRRKAEKKWPKFAAQHQRLLERMRDDYYRGRESSGQ